MKRFASRKQQYLSGSVPTLVLISIYDTFPGLLNVLPQLTIDGNVVCPGIFNRLSPYSAGCLKPNENEEHTAPRCFSDVRLYYFLLERDPRILSTYRKMLMKSRYSWNAP